MPALEKSLRTQLERVVKDARDVAEAGAKSALEQLGVGDSNPAPHLSEAERELRRKLRIHGRQLGDNREEKRGTQEIERLVEEVAYEHWHRMLFARFLAENNLLMYPDPEEPVAISLAECEDMAANEGARNGWELASRYAARMLPQIFRPESPVFEIELPPEYQQRLERFVSELPTDMFTASDSLGWIYQFWQARRKDEVNSSEVKIGARELPAVTQLFTEDYMVDFLLDNTLGAWHAGKVFAANPKLAETAKSEDELRQAMALPGCPWAYLRFIKSGNGKWLPAAGVFDGWPKTASALKCLDPCMGSGHFVVAMFERLVALRIAEVKLNEAEAVSVVIRDNLFGLEIDPRCTQIAAFNLALAAWRRAGYGTLPSMSLACSGLAPNTSEDEWLKLADGNEKLENGMASLYQLFENAPVLGSLINPNAGQSDLLEAGFDELRPLLEQVLVGESSNENFKLKTENYLEMAVTARGLAKASEILACQFTLVATNVPYLGSGNQDEVLKSYCERFHFNAKADLATCFVERSGAFTLLGGCYALVSPQNWLFLSSYKRLREDLLSQTKWELVARLGAKGFQTPMWDFNTQLAIISNQKASESHVFSGIDVSFSKQPDEKASLLRGDLAAPVVLCNQLGQVLNPDARIVLTQAMEGMERLDQYVTATQGISPGDTSRFRCCFWEVAFSSDGWQPLQSTPSGTELFDGLSFAIFNPYSTSCLELDGFRMCGERAWNKRGFAVAKMSKMPAAIYLGVPFDANAPVLSLSDDKEQAAIWCFVSSPEYPSAVRSFDQKLDAAVNVFDKVPFDLEQWQKVAAEKYPEGLPRPFSSDPTQWLFNGHPKDSENPLQVAVARLCGYQWPRQTGSSFPDCPELRPDGLESLADTDGIVCIPPVRGEASATDRLLNLLAKAYGHAWSSDVLPKLLKEAGFEGKGLEIWLRDGFFQQHCELFHQRPFIWQIWDGLRDGFSALVNYHKLDRKNLETLIYTYLGDWMTRQSQDAANGIDGAEERLAAADTLKKRLELILEGEAPHDIFVRWKPLHQQPTGWEPDINDGVRMNIRPFLNVPDVKKKGAGVLREKPKIKWERDRGKEPQRSKDEYPWFWGWDEKTTDFTGGPEFKSERFNDCHYTLDFKRQAKAKAGKP
jgi:hypothetical protein